jgi:hypothetical protein
MALAYHEPVYVRRTVKLAFVLGAACACGTPARTTMPEPAIACDEAKLRAFAGRVGGTVTAIDVETAPARRTTTVACPEQLDDDACTAWGRRHVQLAPSEHLDDVSIGGSRSHFVVKYEVDGDVRSAEVATSVEITTLVQPLADAGHAVRLLTMDRVYESNGRVARVAIAGTSMMRRRVARFSMRVDGPEASISDLSRVGQEIEAAGLVRHSIELELEHGRIALAVTCEP